ncbi:MAG: methyltransferase domain-containing protein [Litorimonas sp.]
MRRAATPTHFETLFRDNPDPWGTFVRRDEAVKRQAILRACGGRAGNALELGCGNGSNTGHLARRAHRLVALDGSQAALDLAGRQTDRRVELHHALLPDGVPRRAFDLVVIAELLYYLRPMEIAATARRLRLSDGARIVLAHHHVDFPDTASRPSTVHDRFARALRADTVRRLVARNGRWRVEVLQTGRSPRRWPIAEPSPHERVRPFKGTAERVGVWQ